MRISVYQLANAIKVPRSRANDIVLERRGITADTAMRFGRYFGTSPEFWINLQARYDLDVANRTLWCKIEREVALGPLLLYLGLAKLILRRSASWSGFTGTNDAGWLPCSVSTDCCGGA